MLILKSLITSLYTIACHISYHSLFHHIFHHIASYITSYHAISYHSISLLIIYYILHHIICDDKILSNFTTISRCGLFVSNAYITLAFDNVSRSAKILSNMLGAKVIQISVFHIKYVTSRIVDTTLSSRWTDGYDMWLLWDRIYAI